ncbi:TonB family protein [Bdellovibrio sp. HCB337]|uniref:TonB family protein n=1 Tax=Bdellovibrio sp. HCB337 TaxID=3394358 RepID=UPI0039A4C1BA
MKSVPNEEPSFRKKKKGQKTFAPRSETQDFSTQLRQGKGSVVEVILTWKERLLTTYHYTKPGLVRVGADGSSGLSLPVGLCPQGWPLLEVGLETRIAVTPDMKIELITADGRTPYDELRQQDKVQHVVGASALKLEQGDIYFISFANSDLQLYIRFVPQPPTVPLPPWIFRSSEVTGIAVSMILLYLYTTMSVKPVKELQEEIPAQIIFAKPTPRPQAPVQKVVVEEQVIPEKITKPAASKAAGGATAKSSQKGGVKQTTNPAASAKTRDVSKMGMFSALNSGGISKRLSKTYDGSGEILGAANTATGSAGADKDIAGDGFGRLKSVGNGAQGTSTVGITGLGTKNGRGTGYGSGVGLGEKGSVSIQAAGDEENFVGTIDREAVRRVIRGGLREIRGCYERELSKLNRTQNLEGKVVIEWTIAEQGRALNVRVKSSTLGNRAVENCVRDRLANWQFPDPPPGGVAEVNYPFYFRAEN